MIYNQMENDDVFTEFWASNELQELSEMYCAGKIDTDVLRWSHILRLRCDKAVHPDMRDLMNKVKMEIGRMCPWMEEAK